MKSILFILWLAIAAAAFGLRADCNQDGRVDAADLAILSEEWLMNLEYIKDGCFDCYGQYWQGGIGVAFERGYVLISGVIQPEPPSVIEVGPVLQIFDNPLPAGNVYKISFRIFDATGGSLITAKAGNLTLGSGLGNGDYTYYIYTDGLNIDTIGFYASYWDVTKSVKIDRISVMAVPIEASIVNHGDFMSDDGWTSGDEWIIDHDEEYGWAVWENLAGSSGNTISQELNISSGSCYYVVYYVEIVPGYGTSITASLGGQSAAAKTKSGRYVDRFDNVVDGTLVFSAAGNLGATVVLVDIKVYKPEDYICVFRGQDGAVNYNHPVASMALNDTDILVPGQTLPAGTQWHYVRKLVKACCDKRSPDSPECVVRIDDGGDIIGDVPNAPVGVRAEALVGGVIRLKWRYSIAGQETPAAGFAVFVYNQDIPKSVLDWYRKPLTEGEFCPANESHPWGFSDGWFGPSGKRYDFEVPCGIVASGIGRNNEFSWTSPALEDGKSYRFIVRSYSAAGVLSVNTNAVSIAADAVGPGPLGAPMVAWSED